MRKGLLAVLMIALTAGPALAQTGGSISGKVTDTAGIGLPGSIGRPCRANR
jgi:hypothetical protein